MTGAPLVADGVVITGISGAEFGTRGFIDGWDPETGKQLWRTYTIAGPGEPAATPGPATPGSTAAARPGSPAPSIRSCTPSTGASATPARGTPAARPGDNLYTCSVLALEPKTGKIKWHYQFSPNDPFDYDASPRWCWPT